MEQSKTVLLTKEKDCKHSVKYSTKDPDAPVQSVYLMRNYANVMPHQITVTIES